MANNANINFEITARNSASGAIRQVNKDLGGLSTAASRAGMGMKAAMVGAGIAIAATAKFIIDSTKKAMAEEQVQNRLIAIMKTRNMVTKESLALIEQQVTKGRNLAYSSEEVRSSMAASIPFAKDMATAQKIQNAAMDVAAAQSISLGRATQIVSRAYMGQGKSLVKLGIQTSEMVNVSKYKLVVDKKATAEKHKQIDALNKQRKAMGLEKLAYGEAIKKREYYSKQEKRIIKGEEVLGLIMQKVGGTAERSAESVAKQFKIFQLSIDDLQQSFGYAFLPIATKVAKVLNESILPTITPLAEKATAFFSENVPKMLAGLDPLFDKLVGENGLVGKFGEIAQTMWGNGKGPLGLAVSSVSDVLGKMLDTTKSILGLAPSAKETFQAYIRYREGERQDLKPDILKRAALPGERSYSDRIASAGNGLAPWESAMPGGAPSAKQMPLPFLKNIPILKDFDISSKGAQFGGAAAGGAGLLSLLLRRKLPGVGGLASLGLGAYFAGDALSQNPSATGGDILTSFAGGAGTAQALGFFAPMLLSGLMGGRKKQGGAGQPGLLQRLGGKLLPQSLASRLGLGGAMPGMGAVGGVGAMQMSAQNVYINAANVMGGGMPGMGMPMGPSPLDLVGPTAAKTGIFSKLAGTRVGGALIAGASQIGASKLGQFFGKGAGLAGKLAGFGSKGLGVLGGAVPILGGLASGLNAAANGKTLGQSLGNGIGTAAGTAIGAGLLSWIPLAGPLLGGTLGAAIGGALGEAIGGAVDPAVKKIQDSIKTIPSYQYGVPTTANNNPYMPPSAGNQTLTVNLNVDGEKFAAYIDKNLGSKWSPYGGSRTTPGAR
jgi:hypothetical protein